MPQATGLQFTATLGELPKDLFAVVRFELTEHLSKLCHCKLELASTAPDISAEEVLEQPVELVVWQDGIPLRRFHGVVNEFARGDSGHRRTCYEVIVQPPLWRLGLMHNSRIFQTQSTDAIMRTLLEERGIIDTVFDLKRTPEEREYCVQHRESDLAFMERLSAEEGWHYRYHHGDVAGEEQPALIIADHHGDAPRLEPVEYNGKAGGSSRQSAIFQFTYRERVKAASVAMKDYTFKNPAYALMHESQADKLDAQREDYQHYDCPGRFKADASGQSFTEARLDALRNDATLAHGQSNRPDFTVGARVELTEHDNQSLNREWLFTSITHTGEQPQALEEDGNGGATTYHNAFNAIPGDRTWRPQVEHRPLMDGPQIAIVTGPEGEEIHCDEHGRVKVRFPWDRYSKNDENSSAWLRVSQGWAGGQYGFMALPRIGHEVIVSFLDGDPDQPIITGRTYHATNTPPYALPEHKTRTTLKTQTHKGEGSNELRFEDEADKEQIYLHAQKDLDLLTENNRTEVIRNDSHLTVDNHRKAHIKGNDHTTVDGEKRESIGDDASLIVNGSHHSKQGKNQLIEAGSEIHHKAGMKIVIEAGAEVTLKAGGSFVKVDPSGVTVVGPMVKMNSGGGPGSVSAAATKVPEQPATLVSQVQPGNTSSHLAATDVREAAIADKVLSTGLLALTPDVLTRVAKAGTTVVSGCEFDSRGRCIIHEHSRSTLGASPASDGVNGGEPERNGNEGTAPDGNTKDARDNVQAGLSAEGETLLKSVEELRLSPYDDQTGSAINSWVKGATIGYGHLISKSEWSIYENGITADQADALFGEDVAPFVAAVNDVINVDLSQHQFDAAVMLAFNIGIGGFSNSSAVALINDSSATTPYSDLESAWKAWNRSQGSVSQGLINRRNAEWRVYSNAVYEKW